MATAPYLIELRGGRFDGYRSLLRFMPNGDRTELPALPSSSGVRRALSRCAVYELNEVKVVLLDDLPTIVFRYSHAETRCRLPPSPSRRYSRWTDWFRRGRMRLSR
jgi:hypothetical protein